MVLEFTVIISGEIIYRLESQRNRPAGGVTTGNERSALHVA
jgi:hypothetical protein